MSAGSSTRRINYHVRKTLRARRVIILFAGISLFYFYAFIHIWLYYWRFWEFKKFKTSLTLVTFVFGVYIIITVWIYSSYTAVFIGMHFNRLYMFYTCVRKRLSSGRLFASCKKFGRNATEKTRRRRKK